MVVPAHVTHTLPHGNKTRLLCTIDRRFTFQCGLNPVGDGNYYIILNSRNLKKMGLLVGQTIHFGICPDPDPLGAPIPEALAELLAQDEATNHAFQQLTPGRKRTIIHSVGRYRNIDKLISTALALIHQPTKAQSRKKGA